MDAKKAAGYFTDGAVPAPTSSPSPRGAASSDGWRAAGPRRAGARRRVSAHAARPSASARGASARSRRSTAGSPTSPSTRRGSTRRRRSRGVGHARAIPRPRASRCTAAGATSAPAATIAAALLDAALAAAPAGERARSRIDLAVTSVLLDAGAGPRWQYARRTPAWRTAAPRASRWRASVSSPPARSRPIPRSRWRADAAGLEALGDDRLARALQVSRREPAARRRAGAPRFCAGSARRCASRPSSSATLPRPGGLLDALLAPGGTHARGAPRSSTRSCAGSGPSGRAGWPSAA